MEYHNYVCSKCWHELGFKWVEGLKWKVFCSNPNCDGTGFHRKEWVKRQREEDLANYMEANFNLRDILFPDREKMTNDQILKELGF